ncbi:MAG: PQQ-dependent sugar dehydrogenase [Chloroflexota bacterium]|nr:PQQ-dependent sugar dehydrogenase [Chloroflexota bacterium]
MCRHLLCVCLLSISLVWGWGRSAAQPGYALAMIAEGFPMPTAIVQPPGDSNHVIVATLRGEVYALDVRDGSQHIFLDISPIVSMETYGEGFLNIAFAPDFETSRRVFVIYTSQDEHVVLARYLAAPNDLLTADPATATVMMRVNHPTEIHFGGGLAFGADGYLYWSIGDGGYRRSPAGRDDTYLGVILRLDVSGNAAVAPAGNPFVQRSGGFPEVWANGLRNPWRISFDALTGDLYIADVGEAQREEINVERAGSPGGRNYGWQAYEGSLPFNVGSTDGLTFPVVEYPHDNGNCSITGGYVYRGTELPELDGRYVFADHCSGWLWTTYERQPGQWYTAELLKTDERITTFGQDANGEL